ncbi:MAG: hypothetical protein JWO59_3574, partial [Chloroflexi bacterium]|nr:hypothetical protein [Chloroflexota bacterium]
PEQSNAAAVPQRTAGIVYYALRLLDRGGRVVVDPAHDRLCLRFEVHDPRRRDDRVEVLGRVTPVCGAIALSGESGLTD